MFTNVILELGSILNLKLRTLDNVNGLTVGKREENDWRMLSRKTLRGGCKILMYTQNKGLYVRAGGRVGSVSYSKDTYRKGFW